MRIGIFGGTFDPIHNGHLVIAQTAINEIPLDQVLFIPAGIPPHKTDHEITSPELRLALVQEAIAGNPRFGVSTVELERQGPSYMIDTLKHFQSDAQHRNDRFFLIIGADNLITFQHWYHYDEILKLCTLAVYPRYESDLLKAAPEVMERAIVFKAPRMEISSSYIRDLVKQGKSIKYLVPEAVERFILRHRLYH